jgi:histidinol dehydrogenase
VPLRLVAGTRGFAAAFAALVASARDTMDKVDAVAAAIVEDVQRRGDVALFDYTRRFDGVKPGRQGLRVPARQIAAAWRAAPAGARKALANASSISTGVRCQAMPRGPMAPDCASAGDGRRSSRSASTCLVDATPIRPPC